MQVCGLKETGTLFKVADKKHREEEAKVHFLGIHIEGERDESRVLCCSGRNNVPCRPIERRDINDNSDSNKNPRQNFLQDVYASRNRLLFQNRVRLYNIDDLFPQRRNKSSS